MGNPIIKDAAEHDPNSFLAGAHESVIKDKRMRQALYHAAQHADPQYFFSGCNFFKDFDKKEIAAIASAHARKDPFDAVHSFSDYSYLPGADRIVLEAVRESIERNPVQALSSSGYRNLPGGMALYREALQRAVQQNPEALMYIPDIWEHPAGFERELDDTIVANPLDLWSRTGSLRGGESTVAKYAESSRDPRVLHLRSIIAQLNQERYEELTQGSASSNVYDESRRIMILASIRTDLSYEQLKRQVKDDGAFIRLLMEYRQNHPETTAGKNALNLYLEQSALRLIQRINELHERPDQERFRSVEGMDARQLYDVIVYGEEELFTSSYNGIFNRLDARMQAEHITAEQLFSMMGNYRFRTFIKLASRYNRLNEFLAMASSPESQRHLLQDFVQGIDGKPDSLEQAVTVADVFSNLQDANIIGTLSETLKVEYARVQKKGDKQGVAMYGLLASMFGQKRNFDDAWVHEMAEKYKLPNVLELPAEKLFNPDGSDIQEYFFYNDDDGKNSYASFIGPYKNNPQWAIEDKGSYVHLVSQTEHGKHIEIFANKPEHEDGTAEINKVLDARKVQSLVVVHRGHSYHAADTIRRIPQIAKIVHLGSCGGYHNINDVLLHAPDAHIISTKGTGTMTVNEPILLALNAKIRAGENINWPKFWAEMEHKLGANQNFANYIPPHKNVGILFLKAYNQIPK